MGKFKKLLRKAKKKANKEAKSFFRKARLKVKGRFSNYNQKFIFPTKLYDLAMQDGFDEALEKAGVQLLDWMSSGSPKTDVKPSIRKGVLAASGSVFIGKKLLKTTEDQGSEGEPNRSYSGKKKELTIGYNTSYATIIHEDFTLQAGIFSKADSGRRPGNQWVTEHLKKDRKDWVDLIAKFLDKNL